MLDRLKENVNNKSIFVHRKKINNTILHRYLWLAMYLLILLDMGGLKPHTVYFMCFMSLLYILYIFRKSGYLFLDCEQCFACKCLIVFGGILSVFVGIDRGESVFGLIRLSTILIAGIAIHQLGEDDKNFFLRKIPILGMMLIAGCIFHRFTFFKGWISAGGRLNGAFEYSNTLALFLLLGIISAEHLYRKEKRAIQLILVIGILGTGSRTVFSVLCGYLFFYFIKYKGKNKYILLAFLIVIGSVCLITVLGVNLYGINRFLKINIHASTFQGRLLYWEDAVRMLAKRPAGLGYMGYFYFQQSEQTGVYSVRFVHNEWLQWLLDYGILSGISLFIYLYLKCRQSPMSVPDKELLCVIGVCSFFDFHLQFFAIVFIVLLLIPKGDMIWRSKWRRKRKGWRRGLPIVTGLLFCLCVTVGIAEYYANREDYRQAVKWNPFSAQYKQEYLLQSEDLDTANIYADKLLRENQYLYAAYMIKSNAAAKNGHLHDFITNRRQVLKLRKYKISEYEDYFKILFNWYLDASEQKNVAEMEECLAAMEEIPALIMKVKKETSFRAYCIQEKPDLSFDQEYICLMRALSGTR